MKLIRVLVCFLLLICGFYLASCDNSTSSHITYSVSINSELPCRIFIAYRDSVGYTTLYTQESWSETILLSDSIIPSLLVIHQLDPDYNPLNELSLFNDKDLLEAQIDNGKKKVRGSGNKAVSLVLSPLE